MLLTAIDSEQATPSLSQAQRMKKLSQRRQAQRRYDAGYYDGAEKPEKM